METKRRLINGVCPILLALAFLLLGCEQPEVGPEPSEAQIFTATLPGGEATKTVLSEAVNNERNVMWQENDLVRIVGATQADYRATSLSAERTSATLVPAANGSAVKQKNASSYYEAFYPASLYRTEDGKLILPSAQSYTPVASTDGNRVVTTHLPMYARSETNALTFHNLCAVLNFKLTGTDADRVSRIEVTSEDSFLCGEFEVAETSAGSGDWHAVMKSSGTGLAKTVALDCTGGVAGGYVQLGAEPTEFCIAVPPADYPQNDLTVEVYGYKGSNTTTEVLLMPAFKNTAAAGSQLKRSEIYDIEKEARVFSVTYNGVTTSSAGTPVTASSAIIGGGSASGFGKHVFTISSDKGYKVTISDKYVAFADKQSNPVSGEVVTVGSVGGQETYLRYGGNSEFQRDAIFSVSATQQVHFSPGNLQFRAKRADGVSTYSPSNTFRFAERQYDVVGRFNAGSYTNSGNVLADSYDPADPDSGLSRNDLIGSDYTGWIDLFGWGTSGKDYGESHYMPYEYVGDNSGYGPVSGNLTLAGESDWGAADIWDGNDLIPGGTYRTLSTSEWEYLVAGRNVLQAGWCSSKVNFFAPRATKTFQITFEAYDDPSYAVTYNVNVTRIESWYGLVIFPDNFADTDLISRAGLSYEGSSIHDHFNRWFGVDAALWPEFERAGCVFLPRNLPGMRAYDSDAGRVTFISFNDPLYWTINPVRSDAKNAYAFWPRGYPITTTGKWVGLSVRLVKDVQ